jgi:hypothetical protein
LSPEYVTDAAGAEYPIVGMPEAVAEVGHQIRSYLRYVRWRDGKAGVKELLNALRLVVGFGWQPLSFERPTPWRRVACATWPDGGWIPGLLEIEAPGPISALNGALLVASSRLLAAHPEVNVTVLRGEVWQRTTPHVVVPFRVGAGDVRVAAFDFSKQTPAGALALVSRAQRQTMRLHRQHPGLSDVGAQLAVAWAKAGALSSPGGALVSLAWNDAVAEGWNALFGGIPIGVCGNAPVRGIVNVGIQIDHRALDREHVAIIHNYLRQEVPKLCAQSS